MGLDCDDVECVRQGLIITIPRSKTDQEGAGRKIGITFGRTRHCPVLALDRWLAVAGIEAGPVFRPVDRHGHVGSERLSTPGPPRAAPAGPTIIQRERGSPSEFSGRRRIGQRKEGND